MNLSRSPVFSTSGMAASSQPLASAAGAEILSRGGNAADAAIAISAALNATEPGSTGLGGDAFALYYCAADRKVYSLNGSGKSPSALTLERISQTGPVEDLPSTHPLLITVPGACAAWCDLHQRFGRLPLNEVFSPAIHLAEEGFPVSPQTSFYWSRQEALLNAAMNGIDLTIHGKAPQPGEIFRNPGLARTLQRVAEGGRDAFYQGRIAEEIVAVIRQAGGCMSLQDMADHTSLWTEPVSVTYRGKRIWECPPNGQGIAALIALNLLEGFDLSSISPLSADYFHLEIEALRLAFADARQFIADPELMPAPLNELLDKAYAAERRRLIHPSSAAVRVENGIPLGSSGTVYFCAVDREGNACSMINSNYKGFGTGIVPKNCGFSLQNRGANFNFIQGHPNCLGPRKRPFHTIIPGMITHSDDDSLFAAFGVMGGYMQPQGHVQVVTGMLDHTLDPQSALEMPRFCIEPDQADGITAVEEGFPIEEFQKLQQMGHALKWVGGTHRAQFGRGQVICRHSATGVLEAGSDPRADGCAIPIL